jgi:hypothetical protein
MAVLELTKQETLDSHRLKLNQALSLIGDLDDSPSSSVLTLLTELEDKNLHKFSFLDESDVNSLPTVNDSISGGYLETSIWVEGNSGNGNAYINVDSTDGAAKWSKFVLQKDSEIKLADTGGTIGTDVYAPNKLVSRNENDTETQDCIRWGDIGNGGCSVELLFNNEERMKLTNAGIETNGVVTLKNEDSASDQVVTIDQGFFDHTREDGDAYSFRSDGDEIFSYNLVGINITTGGLRLGDTLGFWTSGNNTYLAPPVGDLYIQVGQTNRVRFDTNGDVYFRGNAHFNAGNL